MKGQILVGMLVLIAFAGFPVLANAKGIAQGHDEAVTGCLASGSSSGQYELTGQDGNTWTVTAGEYVDLAPYVGHTVTVAGPRTRSHSKSAKTESRLTALDVELPTLVDQASPGAMAVS